MIANEKKARKRKETTAREDRRGSVKAFPKGERAEKKGLKHCPSSNSEQKKKEEKKACENEKKNRCCPSTKKKRSLKKNVCPRGLSSGGERETKKNLIEKRGRGDFITAMREKGGLYIISLRGDFIGKRARRENKQKLLFPSKNRVTKRKRFWLKREPRKKKKDREKKRKDNLYPSRGGKNLIQKKRNRGRSEGKVFKEKSVRGKKRRARSISA